MAFLAPRVESGGMKIVPLSPILTLALIGLSSCSPSSESSGKVDFVADIKPLIQTQCVRCHNDETIMGGLNLMTEASTLRGSSRGPVLIPGDPEKSLFFRVTQLPAEQDHAMPATGPKLTEEEKQLIHQWIAQGAEWPDGPEGTMQPVKIDIKKA